MSRVERINSLLEKELSNFINQEIEVKDCMVTVTYVNVSPDLKTASAGISVLPSNLTGTTLRELRKKSPIFFRTLRKKYSWKNIPEFKWEVDRSSKKAQEIDQAIDEAREKDKEEL